MRWKTGRLSSPAKGLLLAIIQARAEGVDQLTAGEWREEAGIGSGRDWSKALRQLAESGMAELSKRGHMYVINAFALNGSGKDETERKIDRESVKIDNLSIYHTTDAEAAERDAGDQFLSDLGLKYGSNEPDLKYGSNEPDSTVEVNKSGSNEPNYGKYGSNEPKSKVVQMNRISESSSYEPDFSSNEPKSRCVEVDRMDDSGDMARPGSPAQLRRRQQIAVLQEAWTKFFPAAGPLMAENAKAFLRGREESAESVYDLFELVASKNPGSPLAYAKAVMRKSEQAPTAPTSSAFVPGPVSSPEPDPVEEKRVGSAAVKQRIKQWKRFHPNEPVPADLYE